MKKFRGMGKNKKWVYGSLIEMDEDSHQVFIYPFDDHASSFTCQQLVSLNMVQITRDTIGERVDIRTKAVPELYTGDVLVDSTGTKYIVAYDSSYFGFVLKGEYYTIKLNEIIEFQGTLWNMYHIGNIHDNPELNF